MRDLVDPARPIKRPPSPTGPPAHRIPVQLKGNHFTKSFTEGFSRRYARGKEKLGPAILRSERIFQAYCAYCPMGKRSEAAEILKRSCRNALAHHASGREGTTLSGSLAFHRGDRFPGLQEPAAGQEVPAAARKWERSRSN